MSNKFNKFDYVMN